MSAQTFKPNSSSIEGDKHMPIVREIKDMISALATRLADLHNIHKPGSSQHLEHEEEHGGGIITLAGTNVGATMRGDLSGRRDKKYDHDHDDFSSDELEGSDTYVNSNFQAVNNSIMFSASYSANDPGVHMEIVDMVGGRGHKHDKNEKKGVKKGKEVAHGHVKHSGFSE